MSTDLLPLQGYAPDSQPAGAPASAEGHTLTLSLRLGAAMAGRMAVREQPVATPDAVRVRVALPPQSPLTFTR